MSVNVQEWNNSCYAVKEQVKEFNKEIQTNSIDLQKLDSIYKIVDDEVKRLKDFAVTAKKREKELENHHYCNCSPTSRSIWSLAALNNFSKMAATAGAILAFFTTSEIARWAGVGTYLAAETLDFVSSVYETRINLRGLEIVGLSKLNKEGLAHAKIFKKFLKELRKVKQMEQQLIEENRSHGKNSLSDHIVINIPPAKDLNTCINSCIQCYENLPSEDRPNNLHCRIISILIQHLPVNDPLRIGLAALENSAEDLSLRATQPLSVQYFPHTKPTFLSASQSEENKWNNEQHNKTEGKEEVTQKDVINSQVEFDKNFAYYKALIARRFQTKHTLQFIDTPRLRIDSQNGIQRINKNIEELPPVLAVNKEEIKLYTPPSQTTSVLTDVGSPV